MAHQNIKNNERHYANLKLVTFYVLLFTITVIFIVLFAIKFSETRTFDSYEDIYKSGLCVAGADAKEIIKAEENNGYMLYVVSIKKNNDNKYMDTYYCNTIKAYDMLPSILNYFNFVRKNARQKSTILPIYMYNIAGNDKDSILTTISESKTYSIKDLPMLLYVDNRESSTAKNVIETQITGMQNKINEELKK